MTTTLLRLRPRRCRARARRARRAGGRARSPARPPPSFSRSPSAPARPPWAAPSARPPPTAPRCYWNPAGIARLTETDRDVRVRAVVRRRSTSTTPPSRRNTRYGAIGVGLTSVRFDDMDVVTETTNEQQPTGETFTAGSYAVSLSLRERAHGPLRHRRDGQGRPRADRQLVRQRRRLRRRDAVHDAVPRRPPRRVDPELRLQDEDLGLGPQRALRPDPRARTATTATCPSRIETDRYNMPLLMRVGVASDVYQQRRHARDARRGRARAVVGARSTSTSAPRSGLLGGLVQLRGGYQELFMADSDRSLHPRRRPPLRVRLAEPRGGLRLRGARVLQRRQPPRLRAPLLSAARPRSLRHAQCAHPPADPPTAAFPSGEGRRRLQNRPPAGGRGRLGGHGAPPAGPGPSGSGPLLFHTLLRTHHASPFYPPPARRRRPLARPRRPRGDDGPAGVRTAHRHAAHELRDDAGHAQARPGPRRRAGPRPARQRHRPPGRRRHRLERQHDRPPDERRRRLLAGPVPDPRQRPAELQVLLRPGRAGPRPRRLGGRATTATTRSRPARARSRWTSTTSTRPAPTSPTTGARSRPRATRSPSGSASTCGPSTPSTATTPATTRRCASRCAATSARAAASAPVARSRTGAARPARRSPASRASRTTRAVPATTSSRAS